MLAVWITPTLGRRRKFIDCQMAEVGIAVLPIMDVKKQSNLTLELDMRAYWLQEFTRKWLHNPQSNDIWPLLTIQGE